MRWTFTAVALFCGIGSAQNFGGSLRGIVEDPSNARIRLARVAVQSSDSAIHREVASEDHGEFRLDDLPPGRYRLRVTASGFAPAEANVMIPLSSVREVTVRLRPAAKAETVRVAGIASSITLEPIDTASSVHQAVVTDRDLNTFPLASRSFANVAYLAAGTEPVEPSDPTKARITAVSTGGSSGLNNELSVDGADNTDDYIGGFLQNFSPDAIQQFAIRTANEDADTGSTTGASVVITTSRGTDHWHGDSAFYERAAALNARFPIENPTPNPKQPFSRQNYVGTLGGPIKKDKLWVFASFEHVRENASIAYSPANTLQFDALAQLAAHGLIPGVDSIPVVASVGIPFRDLIGSLRFDWTQSLRSQWFLRASIDTYRTRNNLVQQATLPSTGLTTHNHYWNGVVSNSYAFSSNWLGTLVLAASRLRLTQARNSTLGFALQFPFSLTSLTVSGHETFGDNQFATPITAFPEIRNQDKYQVRYDLSHVTGHHSFQLGTNFIHEPVLGGAVSANQETLYSFPQDPTFYTANFANLSQFPLDMAAGASPRSAGDGTFSQNVRRLALYLEDSWRVTRHLTFNLGLRYQTSFRLFVASGRSQVSNPTYSVLPLEGVRAAIPQDDRRQIGPRVGLAFSPGNKGTTVVRAGFGMFYEDLAQTGWITAFQAVNGGIDNSPPAYIDPRYRSPYAIHVTAGVEHALNAHWTVSADYSHEEGNHGYRAYSFPEFNLYKSDNRSTYNALMLHVQGHIINRVDLVANYTLAHAQTWGCILGEIFDYVNAICDPLHPFGPGDYGPSGEDVRHRLVVAGTIRIPTGVELSSLAQAESARPYTITNALASGRISVNGVPTSLDEFRGTAYAQIDLRVSRPFKVNDHVEIRPFGEFFNLLNRSNPGANYVSNVSALPMVPPAEAQSGNVSHVCGNENCSSLVPITSLRQLRLPAGALGDFFGPGTTVGTPFVAQLGVRVTF